MIRSASLMRGLLALTLIVGVAASADKDGWVSLFNGKDLTGWDGDPRFWSVQDGVITGETTDDNKTNGNTFIIWKGGEVGDCEIKFDYRFLSDRGNSGCQYRSFQLKGADRWRIGGYQGDFETGKTYSGILYGEAFRGILCRRGDKSVIGDDHKSKKVGTVGDSNEIQSHIKQKDWNSFHITAKGFNFQHRINGVLTADCTDNDTKMRRAKGLLAFQLHAGPAMKIQFRNIRVKHLASTSTASATKKKKVVFVAGVKSHGFGAHEHNAGSMLLANALNQSGLPIDCKVVTSGWPGDESVFDGADALVFYCDGGRRHYANDKLAYIDSKLKSGAGLVCIHYGVEIPKGEAGNHFLKWIGGYFETHWSVNPHWTAEFKKLPKHPIANGVKPFAINDEWYYHMRFVDGMKGVTPILSAHPPKSTLVRKDGPHSGNPDVRKAVANGEIQHVGWAYERPNGGRGFGFTGGHNHWNWAHPSFRTAVLNAIAWSAGLEVPKGGVPSKTVIYQDLLANQDYDPNWRRYKEADVKKMVADWNK